MNRGLLPRLRVSAAALVLAVTGWAAGCGTTRPMVDPAFEARSYTPARIALLPPDVFAILDQAGDNDPEASAALGRAVTEQAVNLVSEALRRRGYDVDLSAARDGVHAGDGSIVIGGEELGWYVNSVLRFASSSEGEGRGTMKQPIFVAPELAARVGWATRSDAIFYVNVKGVAQSRGKRTAQAVGAVFFVAVIVALIAILMLQSRGGGSNQGPSSSGGGPPRSVRASPSSGGTSGGGATAVVPPGGGPAPAVAVPRGHGRAPSGGRGRTYGGTHVSLGVGVVVPLSGPAHTHEGGVVEDDEALAGDHVWATMTLVSAHDGRVLWHLREDFDVELDDPRDVQRFVDKTLDTLPPSLTQPIVPPR